MQYYLAQRQSGTGTNGNRVLGSCAAVNSVKAAIAQLLIQSHIVQHFETQPSMSDVVQPTTAHRLVMNGSLDEYPLINALLKMAAVSVVY